jgi:hypothetical protein
MTRSLDGNLQIMSLRESYSSLSQADQCHKVGVKTGALVTWMCLAVVAFTPRIGTFPCPQTVELRKQSEGGLEV